MNRHFRTISALLRHDWAIDEAYANDQLPLINAYLNGTFAGSMLGSDDEPRPIGFAMAPKTKASNSGRSQTPTGQFARLELSAESMFSDPDIPTGSVAILDVRGTILKEGFCGSYGTEDYTRELNAIYANDALIGAVILIDSGGGQLSGTPTFYDAIRNPVKPTGVLVNDGMMASAAYWLGCGANFIWASQKTDMIGSIGVFCRLRDNSEYLKQNGIKEITVYSKRSKDKNKAYRDALKGDTKALEAELDESVDYFEQSVRQGRGDKLKVSEDDEPFTGKLYYADQAIAIGLIDGYGDLNAAVARVQELAAETNPESGAEASLPPQDFPAPEGVSDVPAIAGTIPPAADPAEASQSQPNQTQTDMFGDKHKNLTALAGKEADSITDDQLMAINANLDELKITGVRVISTTYAEEAAKSLADLDTAKKQIETLTSERDAARKDAEKFGNQPGHLGSKSPKDEEKTGSTDQKADGDKYFSEVDQEMLDTNARIKRPA